jgi:hypothetical protein
VKKHLLLKWKFLTIPVFAAGAAFLILQCANPVNDPPLRWPVMMEFPITNDSFNIGQTLPDMMDMFNDTIVRFWYDRKKLPWYYPNDTFVRVLERRNARYFSANTVTYSDPIDTTITYMRWEQNHVYKWNDFEWVDLGEVIDILKSGYDSTDNTGIYYVADPRNLLTDYVAGDTVVLSLPRSDSNAYPVDQDRMEDKYYHPTMGLMTILGAPPIVDTLPLLPAGGPYAPASFSLPLSSVQTILFDPASPPISITITNLTGANFTSLDVWVFDSLRSTSLGSFGTAVLSFPTHAYNSGLGYDTGNVIVGGVLDIRVGYTSDAAARLEFSIDPNGLVAGEITAQYSVLQGVQKSFTNDYDLTDTLDIKYIDIKSGRFVYIFNNYMNYNMQVQAEQLHLWSWDMCEARGIDSAAAISGAVDQWDSCAGSPGCLANYLGNLTQGFTDVDAFDSLEMMVSNLAGTRLFPLWNNSLLQSVSRVTYTVRLKTPVNPLAMITLRRTDSMMFTIRAPGFHFKEMAAIVTQEYVRGGETAKLEVSFPFNNESKQSLRDNFKLSQVLANIYLIPRLPDISLPDQIRPAYLGQMQVQYVMYNPDFPGITVSDNAVFTNIINDRLLGQETNITSIMNTWPDSLYITSTIRVPVGTRVLAVNEQQSTDADYFQFMGRMTIGALTLVRANLLFGWAVGPNPAELDLGYGTFQTPDALKEFNRLENPLASVDLRVYNNSNLYMYLHGLVATAPHMNTLRNMPTDTVRKLIGDTAQAHQRGYISLLGPRGIRIPKRGFNNLDSSRVELRKWHLDTMAKYDSCGWRWEASFQTMTADTLNDTDFVFIQSWMHVEGVNNMDSLLTWGN